MFEKPDNTRHAGRLAQERAALPFLLPLLLLVGTFILIPVAGTLYTSFLRDTPYQPTAWTGISNYVRIAGDPAFRQAFLFTLLFVLVSVPLEISAGLALALLLNRPSRSQALLRVAVLIPWAIPAAISARAWELIFAYHHGLAGTLARLSGLAANHINWLGLPATAFACVVLTDIWRTAPFAAIICLGGLQMIPQEIYEQARVDGAGAFQRFSRLTLPLLKPILLVALLFRAIDALRVFDILYVLTGGGPGGHTTSLSLYAYKYYLNGDFGYGAAISTVLFLMAIAVSLALLSRAQPELEAG